MSRPVLLDLFCGAGGAAMGYYRAGFDVVGVDIEPQPNYPFEFHRIDVTKICFVDRGPLVDHAFMTVNTSRFDAIHASPPCQTYSAMSNCRPGLAEEYPDLVSYVRARLEATGLPYIIENVPGAPLLEPITLCGTMFGLELYRHRLFESNVPLATPAHPEHTVPASRAGHWRPGTIMSVSGHVSPVAHARHIMGINWCSRAELAEAVPPAYAECLGRQLMAHVQREVA